MTRFMLSCTAAAFLLATPVVAFAADPAKPMPAKPMAKPMMHKPMMHKAMPKRDAGDAAVDALNDQSLAKAKAGQ